MRDGHTLAFGDYALHFPQRALSKGDAPVRLGSRALDILVALVERAGDLLTRDELITNVWGSVTVDDSALRVHLSALRKALGDGVDGARYIVNETGRGYRFVAPVARLAGPADAGAARASAPARFQTPPAPLGRIIGRADVVEGLAALIPDRRFLTIAGPGGIGKTTVALAVAHHVLATTATPVCFVDFAPVSDPALVANTLAATLGIPLSSADPVQELVAALRDETLLLLFDNCEHLVEALAPVVERLLQGAPSLRLLATSRETLRAEGEWVHRLGSLSVPLAGTVVAGAEDAVRYSAISLFVERATALRDSFALTDANQGAVVDICRRLDGIPLAIELAAARVDQMDVHALAARLDDRFTLLTKGRRTALPRHKTLRATLDWSYGMLAPEEQRVLQRLSVFRAAFDMPAVVAVATCPAIDDLAVFDAITELVAKSLLSVETPGDVPGGGDGTRYRLLDTTRYYALDRLAAGEEAFAVRRRHALYCCGLFADPETVWEGKAPREWLGLHSRRIDDIRAACNWAFSSEGDPALGLTLVASTASLWFHLSLPNEFLGLAEKAFDRVERSDLEGSAPHMELLAAYGHALWHTRGPVPAMAAAFEQAQSLALTLADTALEMRALWGRWAQRILAGRYSESLALAEAFAVPAEASGDLASLQPADHMRALSLHFLGRQAQARAYLEAVIRRDQDPVRANHANHAQVDGKVAAMSLLMRILWLQGHADQAMSLARACVQEALSIDHDLTICYGLSIGSIQIALWNGERDLAVVWTRALKERTTRRALTHWDAWARGYAAVLGLGDTLSPVSTVMQMESLATLPFAPAAAALAADPQAEEMTWCRAEILRQQADALLNQDAPGADDAAQALLNEAMVIASQQGALAWCLRIAVCVARLRHRQGRTAEGVAFLRDVRDRYQEGRQFADLLIADAALDDLRAAL